MMFHMNSKVFQDNFLTNEKDQDILNAQYVLVSNRIRKRKEHDNIISAYSILFPNASTCSAITDDEFEERYYEQLNNSLAFISTLIKGSIEEKYNIIFLCTKKESKLKYLDLFSDFVYLEFGYPVYEYKKYASGASPLRKYDKDKVIKKCNKILNEVKKNSYNNDVKTEKGRERIMKNYKSMKKKDLMKELKKRDLYIEDMSKSEMLDMLEVFL